MESRAIRSLDNKKISVSDRDPNWIRILSGQWLRISIRLQNPHPDSGGQKWPAKIEKIKKFHVASFVAWTSFMEGLGIGILQFFIK